MVVQGAKFKPQDSKMKPQESKILSNQPTSTQPTSQPTSQPASQPANKTAANQQIKQQANHQLTSNQLAKPRNQPSNQPATRGGRRQGRSLKIFAAPPKGEQGVMGPLMKILQILSLEGPRPCRRPLDLCSTNSMFFWTYFRGSFLHPNEPK